MGRHVTYNAGREEGRVLVEVFKDEGKTVDSPKQLTVPVFSIIVLQLLELEIPIFLVRLVLDREFKTNLVELCFSFKIHSTFFEGGTLRVDPMAQGSVPVWHFTYSTGSIISIVFKDDGKTLSTAQNNSQ
jgi:hypothetical protein